MDGIEFGSMRVIETLRFARERGASDLHLAEDRPAALRVDGDLIALGEAAFNAAEVVAFLNDVLDARNRPILDEVGVCDAACEVAGVGPIRLHAFRAGGRLHCAVRLLAQTVPTIESLDVPSAVGELALRTSGLVLIVGPTGSGKTTLLAAMIDALNRRHARHIVTLEDPVEYLHRPHRSTIAQCEVGRDIQAFSDGIRAMLRADPDVIAIGELRDPESIRVALIAAETGHLVLASLHTTDAVCAIDRVVDAFPVEGRSHVRAQLAQSLAAVVSLRLVRRARGPGRRAAVELLIATDAVRNLIREGKSHQLRSTMQTGRAAGMQTLEMHLRALIDAGEITGETGTRCSLRPHELRDATDGGKA